MCSCAFNNRADEPQRHKTIITVIIMSNKVISTNAVINGWSDKRVIIFQERRSLLILYFDGVGLKFNHGRQL